jgi:hypothetical protein
MEIDPVPSSDDSTRRRSPPVDPKLRKASDEFFVSFRSETYRCVRLRETDMLAVPWGPRVDVIFDPKGAPGIIGGTLRVMARTSGTEVELANVPVTSATTPIAISVAAGCDEYVVKAVLGTSPGPNAQRVESYFFARVYAGR